MSGWNNALEIKYLCQFIDQYVFLWKKNINFHKGDPPPRIGAESINDLVKGDVCCLDRH